MVPNRRKLAAAGSVAGAVVLALGPGAPPALSGRTVAGAPTGGCFAGAHTLSPRGSRIYPDTGNGAYTSLHTLVHLVYDANTNRFLHGTRVVLTDRATHCLTSFSLDFERRSRNTRAGPVMTVGSVAVDGQPARFKFVQPTYPGDPNGQNDPNPAAHEASQTNPVGGPRHNPLPPACSPELSSTKRSEQNSLNGTQCPATKLVITPRAPLKNGAVFSVTVRYTGKPGVHNDGDGTTEGWFRVSDGGFVTTEPVGSEDWMPLNDYPAAKPTYDFADAVTRGRTVIANGIPTSVTRNPPNSEFPHGSVTWDWHSAARVASYLVEDSVGNYRLTERTALNGIPFYQAQDAAISPARRKKNQAVIDKQPNITRFESQFSGPYPFSSGGIVVGTSSASFDEEMETMITAAGARINTDTLYHENMHQWWGDNVTESGYRMTFYKEGLATLAEFLYRARLAEIAAGGQHSPKGRAAFQASLARQFAAIYRSGGSFWTGAPSNPKPFTLFAGSSTYARPAAAYVALRQIIGHRAFAAALAQIQRRYGGATITERQLEAAFQEWLPVQSATCRARLSRFFGEWFDTAYPPGGAGHRPKLTGPGLAGPGFYGGRCRLASPAKH
ncbi:MAG TPA: M1 family aminopeptidase [Solirubrobacteraceae bacterium]